MRYFNESEFTMNGKVVFDKMDADFLIDLDNLRECVEEPLIINSSYRSKEYNEKVQKKANKNYIPYSSKSQHLTGNAVDIHCVNGKLRAKIVEYALGLCLSVGVSKTFIHIDNRLNQILFTY